MRVVLAVATMALLAACGSNDSSPAAETKQAATDQNLADSMASDDDANRGGSAPDSRPEMQMQVVLDRLGFGPGVIDGKIGVPTMNAIKGFQEANALEVTGELDDATRQALSQWMVVPSTRQVTIPADWSDTTYTAMPDSAADQAKLDRLGYTSLEERLAERFHTTPEVLRQLNQPASAPATPAATAAASGKATPSAVAFRPGQRITVPNVGADRIDSGAIKNQEWQATMVSLGVGSRQPDVARIVVDESEGWLKAFDSSDKLVAMFTVTTGSGHDPLPIGDWGINGVAFNPPFAYDPDLFWDVPDSAEDQQLPPGPNGPVGVVWIDLTKDHYGIHGTPEPAAIGQTQSHGCVRLTNWDAARLAEMVSGSTKVVFQR